MQQIDLNLLPTFLRVAEVASISQAARLMHLSQPAISLQLKKLEDQLGTRLFDRHKSGLILTRFGEKLVCQSRQMMRSVDAISTLNERENAKPSGTLKIATFASLSAQYLPPIIAKYRALHPTVTIKLHYASTADITKGLINYDYDLAVVSDIDRDPALEEVPLFADEICLYGTRKHPQSLKAKDLETAPLLSHTSPVDYCSEKIRTRFGKYFKKNSGAVVTDCFSTMKNLLLEGAGIAFLPSYAVRQEVAAGRLHKIDIGCCKIPVRYTLRRKHGALQTAAAVEFERLLQMNIEGSVGAPH